MAAVNPSPLLPILSRSPGLGLLRSRRSGSPDSVADIVLRVFGVTELRWDVGPDHLPLVVRGGLDLGDVLRRQVTEPALQLQVLDDEVLLVGDEVVVGP